MRFQQESYADLIEEMRPLVEAHYDELALDKDIPLEPDHDKYSVLNEMGVIQVFTARDDKDNLVGYALYMVAPNLHYKSSLQANQDVLFVHKDFRRGGFGSDFIDWCDETLKTMGVQKTYHHVKPNICDFGPLLVKKGYKMCDVIYSKRLDK